MKNADREGKKTGMPENLPESQESMFERNQFLLNGIPCAAYLVKNDPEFTLLCGNALFFRLFGCTEEEMKYKYGNRLGALIYPEFLKQISGLEVSGEGGPVHSCRLKQRIKRNGGDAWIETEAVQRQYGDANVIFCTSIDITDSEEKLQELLERDETEHFIVTQANYDSFGYDPLTKKAVFYATGTVLDRLLPLERYVDEDFGELLVQMGIVHPEHIGVFRETFGSICREHTKAVCELKMRTMEGRYLWVRMTLCLKEKETLGRQDAIGILEDITQQREAFLSLLNETQFYQAILSEKDAYAHIDVTEDKITWVGGLWDSNTDVIHEMTYTQLLTVFLDHRVHPDDRERYQELMERSNFTNSLDNGIDRLGCEFRVVNQGKTAWMELSVHLFRDPVTSHVLVLLYLKNIDSKKRQEQARERTLVRGSGAGVCRASELGEDLLSAQTGLKAETEQFGSFVAEHGDIAYLIDPDTYDLICGNQAFYDRIGISEEEAAGLKCYEAMQKRTTPCPFCSKANWSSSQFFLWRNLNMAMGQEFLIKNKLVRWKDQEALLALAVDISNNKSIADSLDNEAMESHSILSGVQRMTEADSLEKAVDSALGTIGHFFRASDVCFWEYGKRERTYRCTYSWRRNGDAPVSTDTAEKGIDAWLQGRKWDHSVLIETPEAILPDSFELYQYMKRKKIRNQRWVQIRDGENELGCIEADNCSSNFKNMVFLESFSTFIAEEIKKRTLMAGILYSNQHDDLTGLQSRSSFEKYMLGYRSDSVSSAGVLIANFNNLKGINSSRGFVTGNYFIKLFAEMLKDAFGTYEIFRLNGDEFLVIAENIGEEELERRIKRLELLIGESGSFTVSLGSSWDNVENDLNVLIEQATQTMKVNKRRHYDANMVSVDLERRKMLNDLVDSLENGEFEVYLQPKVELMHGIVIGAEALIRYNHRKLGVILPGQFIGILEKSNMIRYIDLFVFEEVCRILESWKKRGLFLPVISLNFSRLTLLERDILFSMETIISRYDVSRKYVEIEITESVAGLGKNIICQAARDLYDAGFSLSLDDFGTKYTNLSILADINFDVLKLDRSLVGALSTQKNNQIILKNVIKMCEDLGIDVIAEGIETESQEAILRRMRCKLGQGYLYGRPMPVKEFEERCSRPAPIL